MLNQYGKIVSVRKSITALDENRLAGYHGGNSSGGQLSPA
jgi:hypothetical protein